MVKRYQTYSVIAVLFGCFCTQAVAVQFTPDHQWTFKLGERAYGIAGYGARPGRPPHSYLLFAGTAYEIPLPFSATVACLSLPLLAITVLLPRIFARRYENAA